MEGNTLKLSENAKLEVEVGKYGIYVRLTKRDKIITFSDKSWRFISNNAAVISSSFKSENDYGLTVTANKDIKLSVYRGQTFVSFHERTEGVPELNKYVNLSQDEWNVLADSLDAVKDALLMDIAYCSKDDDDWMLSKDVVYDASRRQLKSRLIPRMEQSQLTTLLHAFLISEKIAASSYENCLGCKYASPSQIDHMPEIVFFF